jgi:3'-5' exoribonuclease
LSKKASAHQLIKHVEVGQDFEGVYYVESVQQKVAKNGNVYADIALRDKSGRTYARYWSSVKKVKKGDYVAVHANVEEYMGAKQVVIREMLRVDSPDDMTNLISHCKTLEQDKGRFADLLKSLQEHDVEGTCFAVADRIFGDTEFFQNFVSVPCSVVPHYGCVGGLLHHTVRTTDMALCVSRHYDFDDFERCILIAAGLLHRIGAVDSYTIEGCSPIETTKGILLTTELLTVKRVTAAAHTVLGEEKVMMSDTVVRLMHAIASHGGLVKAMTKEAMVLSEICRTDANVVSAFDFIAQDPNDNDEFTAWDSTKKRRYFKGTHVSA